jgi:hypothetical protein
MPHSRQRSDLIIIVNAVVDGRITAKDAGSGTPPVVQVMFEIAENLGRLNRGLSAEFTPPQAGLLYEIIDAAVDLMFSGREPASTTEEIALRLMDLAFELDDPMSWIINLNAVSAGDRCWTAHPGEMALPT